MAPGIEQINSYLEQVSETWESNPGIARDRGFFQAWEQHTQPRAFVVTEQTLTLFGKSFALDEDLTPCIGFFDWLADQECVGLVLENRSCRECFLIQLNESGQPMATALDLDFTSDYEIRYGRRLEFVYDLIAHTRKQHPEMNVLKLTRKEYLSVLEEIVDRFDGALIKAMRRIKQGKLKDLLAAACEDMTSDELSNQLTLPLDGTYAARATDEEQSSEVDGEATTVPAHTPWRIMHEVEFISDATSLVAASDEDFVLDFIDGRKVSETAEQDAVVMIPADEEAMPLREGDILKVYERGNQSTVGTFKVDLFDGEIIIGRLRSDVGPDEYDNIYALPRKSPNRAVAESIEFVLSECRRDLNRLSPATQAALGTRDLEYPAVGQIGKSKVLDVSQAEAVTCPADRERPVALIQGPPGTGKTYVLEKLLRVLSKQRLRILVAAPSNVAIDNVCRRVFDLPVLRFGRYEHSVAKDVQQNCWIGIDLNVAKYSRKRAEQGCGIYAGTHASIYRDRIVTDDAHQNGPFDVVIFDEAGMARIDEFLLCAQLAKRVVLFGDHQQLPPFPIPMSVREELNANDPPYPMTFWRMAEKSALEWLVEERGFPVHMLKYSYRCQNPRLMRFSSILFYDAAVKPSPQAEYFKLSYQERLTTYPPSTLRLYRTSNLSPKQRGEEIIYEGKQPGMQNRAEAIVCQKVFMDLVRRYPVSEITVIAPYRRQVRLLKAALSLDEARQVSPFEISDRDWIQFVHGRIATVDSFQGGESDAVIVSYVRSNHEQGIGFVDDPNRINVAHTRCRKEMIVIGDIACLKKQAKSDIFARMEQAFQRDGEIIDVDREFLERPNTEPLAAVVLTESTDSSSEPASTEDSKDDLIQPELL